MPDVRQIAERMQAEHGALTTGAMTLVLEFPSHGAHCEVFALPRMNWTPARYEWCVSYGGGGWDRGRTVELSMAINRAVDAARLRWEGERERQRAAVEGQGEVVNCET